MPTITFDKPLSAEFTFQPKDPAYELKFTLFFGTEDDDTYGSRNERHDKPVMAFGAGGNDTIYGTRFDDSINGGEGDDTLNGSGGNDRIDGGSGRDRIEGGAGDDILTGGADADRFEFSAMQGYIDTGHDVITDFQDGSDLIVFGIYRYGQGPEDMDDLTIYDTGDGAMIEFGQNSILLQNVQASDLDQSDFLFL